MIKQVLLKIGLIIMPIIVWLSFGILSSSSLNLLMPPPEPIQYIGTAEGYEISYNLSPFYGYAVLALCIYVSIKGWIKYVAQLK